MILATAATFLTLSAAGYAQDTVVIPGEVRTYVMEQQVPSVAYEGDVVVGKVIPDTVEIHTIDGHADYAYTVVNDHRVIVNPQTRTVVQVLE